jgi:hypothetical protein
VQASQEQSKVTKERLLRIEKEIQSLETKATVGTKANGPGARKP